ncbi:Homeobox-DDT domain protein RLT2-like protein [Drosera capensis]
MEGSGGSSEGERKQAPDGGGGGEGRVKRKMKTAAQLEALEKTYQEDSYPSESKRAEMSAQLNLSDRQLQMWFCHRRLKDKKEPSTKRQRKGGGGVSPADGATPPAMPPPIAPAPTPIVKDDLGFESVNERGIGSGSGSSPFRHIEARRSVVPRATGVALPRISPSYRYYEPPQVTLEQQAIMFIEAQLGEPLREDGPALGMEFDPLPPGAFGAPIDTPVASQSQRVLAYDSNLYERPDAKLIKGPGGVVHEYQFLPEQPVRTDSYDRTQSQFYGSPLRGPDTRTTPLSGGHTYMRSVEEFPVGFPLPSQMQSASFLSSQGKQGHHLSSTSGEHEVTHKSPYMRMALDSTFGAHPISGLDNALTSSERRAISEDDVARVEQKRKNDEARIAREVEVHEKRTRRELEKQDIMRRKREEQLKKEMERHDRERRKEEERLLREKQREEERYLREQRREMEQREKFLLKESIRAEKMRQKEEIRKEKEAARQKAANDRAAARRIAKESMEPIEDERLELMDIAVSMKGLPSILALDSETLENLDSYRDLLKAFPPKSVQLKRPFTVQPWTDSDENVANLLMVWRFLITFADILGLWPFTLDEFVQAFHDYEPRLLGEIHIGLLKTIVKDIEDVARIPSANSGGNQCSSANPGGGHPQLVEGAYAWGFDIRSWQHHLNPLTWPEILRQFALSAGSGPKLKKRNIDLAYLRDDNEGDDGANVISNLRTGAAVENAVAKMQERGYGIPRRSRHRLTPGTVKFAAFHVLSLEGRNGLNILEVADRIQKSGLRDLTTSKTPEASVAAALSRDTKLFERVAPSTYCVRTPYRKDPEDAEAILAAAREKIRAFSSGFVDGVEADDVEKDESSESDAAEDPEVDDLAVDLTLNQDADTSFGVNPSEVMASLGNGIRTSHDAVSKNPVNGLEMGDVSFASMQPQELKELRSAGESVEGMVDFDRTYLEETNTEPEDTDIDESCPGEPWVQGLVEGEYSDLSVEERLNALAALIGIATEGNTIRAVLEERLEAATALKKQMLAEAQVDKRRIKEEYMMKTQYTTIPGSRSEPRTAGTENRLTPTPVFEVKYEPSGNLVVHQTPLRESQFDQKPFSDLHSEKNFITPDTFVSPDNLALQQTAYAAERSRAQIKSYISHKAEEMYVYRSLPLGLDRRYNRYWQFMASASHNDPGSGRIFVELRDGGWKLIDSAEVFDALLSSLDVRGIRESHLHAFLLRVEPLFKETLRWKLFGTSTGKQRGDSKAFEAAASFHSHSGGGKDSPSSGISALDSNSPEPSLSFHVECGKNKLELVNVMKWQRDSDEWMRKECLSSSVLRAMKYGKKRCSPLLDVCDQCHDMYFFEDKHCPFCHRTYTSLEDRFNFSLHMARCEETSKVNWKSCLLPNSPPRITLLKVLLALVEASVPAEAFQPVWADGYRRSWGMKLHTSASADEILQVLSLWEGAVKKDFLSSDFQTTKELLASSKVPASASNFTFDLGSASVLPWVPHTTAAVALRLIELDSAVSYLLDQKPTSEKVSVAVDQMDLQSNYNVVRNIEDNEVANAHAQLLQDDTWMDPEGGHRSLSNSRPGRGSGSTSGRGRGRTRGGRSQRRASSSHTELSRRTVASTAGDRFGPVLGGWKGRSRGRGRGRKRRSVRSRQKPLKKDPAVSGQKLGQQPVDFHRPHGSFARDGWNAEGSTRMQVQDAANDIDSDGSEYGNADYNQETGYGYDVPGDEYRSAYSGRSVDLSRSDYNDRGEDVEDEDEEDDDVHDGNGDDYREDVGDDYDQEEVGDDEYDDEVDVNDGGYEQGDVEIDRYFNADSDEEGDGVEDDAGHGNNRDDDTASSSTDYSH